jgi:D-alanine-D-alanine ligase
MQTIAVIFGGRSAEHDVSIVTALSSVIKPLELLRTYRVEAIYVAKDGAWYWDDKLKDIKLYTSGAIADFLHRSQPLALQFDGGLKLVKSSGLAGRKLQRKVDLVFPAMHGTHGEDGELMGLLEMANVPYVGCDMPSSAIAMDKVLAKLIAQSHGINTPDFHYFHKAEFERDSNGTIHSVNEKLQYPVFVKPAHLGSSIGITRVADKKDLLNAIEVAAHYDDKVLVEEAVPNLIEVTLPIMGNTELAAALLERPMTKPEDFFDFDTKYMQGSKKGGGKSGGEAKRGAQGYSQLPADIPRDLYDKAVETGLDVYRAIGCSGIARVDMLIDRKSKKVYFNEVNPLPGDLYAHNWNRSGLSKIQLASRLVQLAQERWQRKQQQTTTFSTNYLKQF